MLPIDLLTPQAGLTKAGEKLRRELAAEAESLAAMQDDIAGRNAALTGAPVTAERLDARRKLKLDMAEAKTLEISLRARIENEYRPAWEAALMAEYDRAHSDRDKYGHEVATALVKVKVNDFVFDEDAAARLAGNHPAVIDAETRKMTYSNQRNDNSRWRANTDAITKLQAEVEHLTDRLMAVA